MTKIVFFLFLFLLAVTDVSAQSKHAAIIEGRIINKDGEPAAGIKVKLTEHGCFRTETTTDAYGMYQLKPATGKYEITVKYRSGAEDKRENLTVSTGDNIKLDFSEKEIKHTEVVENAEEEDYN